jgi:hypothetical protein
LICTPAHVITDVANLKAQMTVSTAKKTEIADRRQRVSEKYLRGMYMTDIARDMGVDTATVSRDLAELRKEWLDRSINHIDQKKAIELAKLDRLEVTYWDAWERSKLDAETEITKSTPNGHVHEVRREGQSGNPAFLAGVMSCINKRCEILGLDAPKKADVTSGGQPIKQNDSEYDRALITLAEALGKVLPGEIPGKESNLAAAEPPTVASAAESGG